ncbi:MAG: DegV family protein [Oscillospiraceae bacterium]|jgi:DegV family protein with EDD domain|nr:DegV family protein [Oscillospiraceae bacterium]
MNRSIVVTTDSSSDLPPEIREEYGVQFFPLFINLEGKFYHDCVDIFPEQIYSAYKERGIIAKTAAPSIEDYKEFFAKFVSQGKTVLHISLTHAFSSCNHIATLAAAEIKNVHVVDSFNFCTGSGALCVEAAKLCTQDLPIDVIVAQVKDLRAKVRAYYLPGELTFIKNGGRCSAISAFGANLLKIRPQVSMDTTTGEVSIGKKFRGTLAAAQEAFIRSAAEACREKLNPTQVYVMHTPDVPPEQYAALEAIAREALPEVRRWITGSIGCVIAAHCGPECCGFIALER